MHVQIKKSQWCFNANGWRFLSEPPRVRVDGELKRVQPGRMDARKAVFAGSLGDLRIELRWRDLTDGAIGAFLKITNRGAKAVFLDQVVLGRIRLSSVQADSVESAQRRRRLRMLLYNDCASWDVMPKLMDRLLSVGSRPLLREPAAFGEARGSRSRLFTAIYDSAQVAAGGSGIILGFRPVGKRVFETEFVLEQSALAMHLHLQTPLEPSAEMEVGELLISAAHTNLWSRLEAYASSFGPARQSARPARRAGWNTWDYYFWDVSAKDVLENTAFIRKTPWLRRRIKYVVVDDGWFHCYGEWHPNYRFAEGMDGLARRIRKAGFVPGIWTGPFLQSVRSTVAVHYPEWVIRHPENGRPVVLGDEFMSVITLDPTHPGTFGFLEEMYTRLRREGYGYFKIDFLSFPGIAVRHGGKLHDPHMGLFGGLRKCLEIIRRVIGEDAHLLGCGGFIPEIGAGLYDSCRSSMDTSSYWSNIQTIARDIAVKSVFDRRVWENDYDFLMARCRETAREVRINVYRDQRMVFSEIPYQPFTLRSGRPIEKLQEVRVWISLLLVSGGPFFLADRLEMLNPNGLKLLHTAFEYGLGVPGRPLDLFGDQVPRVWMARDSSRTLIGVFNWTDRASIVRLSPFLRTENLPSTRGYEIWSRKWMELDLISLGPRDCRVWTIAS